jgi:trehalose 6-phosphate phosphatase
VFDLDGVITSTARLHVRAWKETFDAWLRGRDPDARPFDPDDDYRRFVDGKPRYQGVESFLGSRDIELPHGDPDDPPDRDTVCGIGNRKNRRYLALLDEEGVEPYPDAEALLESARQRGLRTALISASRNARRILVQTGLESSFDVRVDGAVAADQGLEDKTAILREAARRLDVDPSRAVLFEDAISGVEAGRSASYGRVIGVARGHDGRDLT